MAEGYRVDLAAPRDGSPDIWHSIWESLSGSQQDFTEGSIGRAIFLLSVPMVLEMAMESLFGIVDVFFVARLGAEAVAAVGLTESILTIVYAIAMGLSMATTAMVARRVGEKDRHGAAVAATQSVWIGLAFSVVIGIAGVLLAPRLLAAMGGSTSLVNSGWGYTAVILGSSVTIFPLFLINAIFRGAGDAALAMRALWFGNLINIVLDPCFIFGLGPFPEMGVTGAAVATAIGRGSGVAFQVVMLWRGRTRVRVHREDWRFNLPVLARLLRVASSGMLQFLIGTASWLGLVRIVALSGSAALAGYTIAVRIIIFSILPSWGMCNAAATLVGQNLGAGKPDRAERSVWLTGLCNMVFLMGVGVVFLSFAESLVLLFTSDTTVIPHARDCLRIVSYGYPFYAFGMVMVQAFNGAGDTWTPSLINFFCYWLLQIPLAALLAIGLNVGPPGVFWAITVAESILAVAGILVFRRGRWKEKRI